MPQRLRALREHDGWWQFSYVMLMQALKCAERGDRHERCWLIEAPMSAMCYEIVGLDAEVAREALIERWNYAPIKSNQHAYATPSLQSKRLDCAERQMRPTGDASGGV